MGLIYNGNVKESQICQAYGLTVYGKVNLYEWAIRNGERENALITIRITDTNGNDIFSMYMGNNCIFQSRIDDTLDNFLWWIAEDKPDSHLIERQVYESLCVSDCLFNHSIQQRKIRQKREEKEKKRIAEHEAAESANKDSIKAYCMKKGLIPYFAYDYVYIIQPYNEKVKNLFAQTDDKQMEWLIDFMKQHPENKDVHIIKCGSIEEILKYIA